MVHEEKELLQVSVMVSDSTWICSGRTMDAAAPFPVQAMSRTVNVLLVAMLFHRAFLFRNTR